MTYYINGEQVTAKQAYRAFRDAPQNSGNEPSAILADWLACQQSEDARDNYLPSHIEIVA